MSIEVLSSLVRDLGAVVGIPDLRLDEDNRVNLMLDDVPLSIELAGSGEAVALYSLLDQLPAGGDDASVFRQLLNANYLHRETEGATLGVESESRNVVLIREDSLMSLDAHMFETIIERFVNLAAHWRQVLSAARYDSGGAAAAEADQGAVDDPGSPSQGMRV